MNFDELLASHQAHADKADPRQAGKDFPNPNFPPKMSVNEKLASLDNVPLFMHDLPNEQDKAADPGRETSDVALEALQNLAHAGTPEEIASNFKDQGNEYFQGKRFREAASFYTQGLQAKPPEGKIKQSLLLNRAACNLELKNYRQVILDTDAVLAQDDKNEKGYYRKVRAQLALGKGADALVTANKGLAVNERNKDLVALMRKASEMVQAAEKKEAEKKERELRKTTTSRCLLNALAARGLVVQPPVPQGDSDLPGPSFSPEAMQKLEVVPLSQPNDWKPPDIVRTPLQLPVLVLYPGVGQSELLPVWDEDATIADGIGALLPAPEQGGPAHPSWGKGYTVSEVNVYAVTKQRRALRLGLQRSLREAIDSASKDEAEEHKRDGLVLKHGRLAFFVVPRGSDAEKQWIARFKANPQDPSFDV